MARFAQHGDPRVRAYVEAMLGHPLSGHDALTSDEDSAADLDRPASAGPPPWDDEDPGPTDADWPGGRFPVP